MKTSFPHSHTTLKIFEGIFRCGNMENSATSCILEVNEICPNFWGMLIRYSFYTLKLFKYFHSKDELDNFVDIYIKTFENNSWFSSLEVIQLVIRSSLNAGKIYDILRERKLLNPFQLAIFSIF